MLVVDIVERDFGLCVTRRGRVVAGVVVGGGGGDRLLGRCRAFVVVVGFLGDIVGGGGRAVAAFTGG